MRVSQYASVMIFLTLAWTTERAHTHTHTHTHTHRSLKWIPCKYMEDWNDAVISNSVYKNTLLIECVCVCVCVCVCKRERVRIRFRGMLRARTGAFVLLSTQSPTQAELS